ncbi:MAG: YqgE/AlgH family protein [Fibromonadaceae bacterium]|jgi:putative transcriptional regulator|nr:YqgE/AlgH family protein [Fibromonadaceae bacterium]
MQREIIRPGDFLLATPALGGSYFNDSVIFIVEHGRAGSWGLVINNPVHIPLDEVFSRNRRVEKPPIPFEFMLERPLHTFFFGGPVQGTAPFQNLSVCILEVGKSVFEGNTEISQGVFISRIPLSMEIPVSMLIAPQNQTARMFFGYSGWGKDQLEREILDGAWEVSSPFPFEVFSQSRDKIHVTVNKFREYHERSRA